MLGASAILKDAIQVRFLENGNTFFTCREGKSVTVFFSEWGRSPDKHQVFVVVVVVCVCMSEDACIKYLLALSPVLTEKQFYVKQHCIHRSLHEGGLAKRELAAEERTCVWHVLIDCLR